MSSNILVFGWITIAAAVLPFRSTAGELILPKVNQIVTFANNPRFQHTTDTAYQVLSKTQFDKFLKSGKSFPLSMPRNDLQLGGPVTFTGTLPPLLRAVIKQEGNGLEEGKSEITLICQGVAVTSETIYFWQLKNDKVLWIGDEKNNGCYLRID